jgi:hypothetical protein
MDPVTGVQLIASAADLATLAFTLFSNLHKYYRNVKEAPKRSAELRSEVESLLDLIIELEELLKCNRNDLFPSSVGVEITGFCELLRNMLDRTEPQQTKGIQRLQWPFKEHENAEYISKMEGYRDKLTLALSIHQTYYSSDPICNLESRVTRD